MADTSDVENALREIVQGVRDALFAGVPVGRGWPSDDDLNRAASGVGLVTVWQRPGFVRNVSRYEFLPDELPAVAPSLTVSLNGTVATFAGTCSTDQIAGVRVGGTAYAVRCGASDTPSTVAATLGGLCGGLVSGATLGVARLTEARTARDGRTLTPTRQQDVGFMVIVWTSDPIRRDVIAAAIDAALSNMQFILLADGSYGRLKWAGSMPTDKDRSGLLYRRDLQYMVEFSTTIPGLLPRVLFPDVGFQVMAG